MRERWKHAGTDHFASRCSFNIMPLEVNTVTGEFNLSPSIPEAPLVVKSHVDKLDQGTFAHSSQ